MTPEIALCPDLWPPATRDSLASTPCRNIDRWSEFLRIVRTPIIRIPAPSTIALHEYFRENRSPLSLPSQTGWLFTCSFEKFLNYPTCFHQIFHSIPFQTKYTYNEFNRPPLWITLPWSGICEDHRFRGWSILFRVTVARQTAERKRRRGGGGVERGAR